MGRVSTGESQGRCAFLMRCGRHGVREMLSIAEVEEVLRMHCHRVVVRRLMESLTAVEKDGINIQISFHEASWCYPYEDQGFARALFHRVLCVAWFADGFDQVPLSADEQESAAGMIAAYACELAAAFPRVAEVFENVYGIRFDDLRAGTYPRT